jgi:hypothetical protein
MGRLRLGAIVAFTLAFAGPAGAAEIARVASRGEPGNPFDMHVEIRWDRFEESARITRERASGNGVVQDGDELRFTRTVNALVPRVAIGLAEDLDLHFEWPYVLADDRAWRFGIVNGAPTGGVPPYSSIETNDVDASGAACTVDLDPVVPGTNCALFPVAPSTTVYHGGKAGDLKVGVSWGIFNDRKDPTKPFWLAGVDVTFPTAALHDPAAGRGTNWMSPYSAPGKPGPFGEKVWKWDFFTVMSRRMGPIDPYVKAHATVMRKSSSTYSNCDHAAELATVSATNPVAQMNSEAIAACADSGRASDAEARLPWVTGLTVGTEIVPYEDAREQQKVSIDVRLTGDYTSSQRFYNELTDASGKLHHTEEYLTLGGFLGLYLRASKYVSLTASASLATNTAHYLTGEAPGRDGSGSTAAGQLNPNFDWRYDAPGRRFKISEVSIFEVSFGGVLTF